jgi:hypothetical protein
VGFNPSNRVMARRMQESGMLNYSRIPLLFLFIGSLLGVLLRWQFISTTPGINYSFFLHGHSHTMFLGWIFNALYIGFVSNHILERDQHFFRRLFIALQVLVVAMLISFPIQGYGSFSILFSTLHTVGALIFLFQFFRCTRSITATSLWYARIALLFFIMSAIGPFALGYLTSIGLGQTNWYFFSIYFYLHFQYNGFFLFGVMSLFFNVIEEKKIPFDNFKAKRMGLIMAIACVPAYLLSVLWANPGYLFNVIGALSAATQIVAFIILLTLVIDIRFELRKHIPRATRILLCIASFAFALKLILQLLSAAPDVARMTYELRPIVIAYLHLVLLGMISICLFAWYLEQNLIQRSSARQAIDLYILSFLGMEGALILSPWWSSIFGSGVYPSSVSIFIFSATLSISCLLLYVASAKRHMTKITKVG